MAPSEQNDLYLRTVWPVFLLQARRSFDQAVPPRPLISPPLRWAPTPLPSPMGRWRQATVYISPSTPARATVCRLPCLGYSAE